MATVQFFTVNPFQENTYIVYDDTKDCVIIDPGCYTQVERDRLADFISKEGLNPVRLLNTHCHVDHVFGNAFIANTYNLPLEIHKGELPVLERYPMIADMYGIPNIQQSPEAEKFLAEGDIIQFGNTMMSVLFAPGHSPASICFYSEADKFIIAGDVLFYDSIGRTDLPGGDYDTLINSIKTQLLPLPDDVKVYPGHGPATTVGRERQFNPFLR
ncbi:MAG: MBL fold metallo-hydrolase [Saprospiraceae bacterium]|nr:MBL fold metallo-hydrolase [Saprospiraceae bacterium]